MLCNIFKSKNKINLLCNNAKLKKLIISYYFKKIENNNNFQRSLTYINAFFALDNINVFLITSTGILIINILNTIVFMRYVLVFARKIVNH